MTHPKRPISTTAAAGSSSSTFTARGPLSPSASMKKSKPHHPVGDDDDCALASADDDTMLVDELKSAAGVASNLSRKKAALPQPSSAKKQLVIKLNKGQPRLPTNFEEDTWGVLKSAITAIFLKQPDSCDSEKLYQAVNDLCLHKMGGKLYERIQKECEVNILKTLQSLVGQSPDLVVFLSLVENCWQDFCDQMLMIRGIALYLDRTYVKQNPNISSLWDMGLQLFRKHLSLSPGIEHKIVTGLLRLIEKERLGEAIDRTVLNHLLKMFTALGIYTEIFEKPFLECTSEFYASEGVKYMQQSDIPNYLKHVVSRLHEEHERCLLYLDANTKKPLIATTEKQLLERHTSSILDKGFTMLMEASRIEDLQRMYTLFLRVNALEVLRQGLGSYIRSTGQGIIMDEEKDKDLVASLLEFKSSLDRIWEESFSRNEAFSNTIKDAFEHLINLRQNKPAELIAKFLDEKLRAGNKGTSEEELEGTLDKVLVLFRFIQGKDVFEAFYKKDLAKRLLMGKSASIDAEKSMISKLKTECGSQFTNKLEGMFKDIELSKEINDSFKQSSQARTKLPSGIELSVHVLTTGYWPTYPPMDVRLPRELNVYQDIFKEFYLSKYSGRRLMWQNSLCHCVLKAEFPRGKKELAVSLFQIKDSTGIEDKELRRTLQSLACGKVRVLQKSPKGREVEDEDSFVFNEEFSAPLYRIKVNAIQMKETVEENTSTSERVFQDRQYQSELPLPTKKHLQPDNTMRPNGDDAFSETSVNAASQRASKAKITVATAPVFKCPEHSEQRKEFYSQLEAKQKALEAEKRQLEAKMKPPPTRAKSPKLGRRKSFGDEMNLPQEHKDGVACGRMYRHSLDSCKEDTSILQSHPSRRKASSKNKEGTNSKE